MFSTNEKQFVLMSVFVGKILTVNCNNNNNNNNVSGLSATDFILWFLLHPQVWRCSDQRVLGGVCRPLC